MVKNKKALMFTFIAITLLMVIMVSFLITLQTSSKTETEKLMAKATSVNAFVQNINPNAESSLKASGNQAVLALQDYMDVEEEYLTGNSNEVFREAITEGKYRGVQLRMMEKIIDGKEINFTIGATLNELRAIASRSNILLSYDPIDSSSISFSMKSPWELGMNLQLRNVKVADREKELTWNLGNLDINADIPISKYRDPVYLVSDNVNISVKKTSIIQFEKVEDLRSFISNFEFYAHPDAPDFIQRMFGQFDSSSVNGYETILGSSGHQPNTPNPNSNSYVDFMYWGGKASAPDCGVTGIPGIDLDDAHKTLYTGSSC